MTFRQLFPFARERRPIQRHSLKKFIIFLSGSEQMKSSIDLEHFEM